MKKSIFKTVWILPFVALSAVVWSCSSEDHEPILYSSTSTQEAGDWDDNSVPRLRNSSESHANTHRVYLGAVTERCPVNQSTCTHQVKFYTRWVYAAGKLTGSTETEFVHGCKNNVTLSVIPYENLTYSPMRYGTNPNTVELVQKFFVGVGFYRPGDPLAKANTTVTSIAQYSPGMGIDTKVTFSGTGVKRGG